MHTNSSNDTRTHTPGVLARHLRAMPTRLAYAFFFNRDDTHSTHTHTQSLRQPCETHLLVSSNGMSVHHSAL